MSSVSLFTASSETVQPLFDEEKDREGTSPCAMVSNPDSRVSHGVTCIFLFFLDFSEVVVLFPSVLFSVFIPPLLLEP